MPFNLVEGRDIEPLVTGLLTAAINRNDIGVALAERVVHLVDHEAKCVASIKSVIDRQRVENITQYAGVAKHEHALDRLVRIGRLH